MSNLSLETIKRPEQISEKRNMVKLFHVYCIDKFGTDKWQEFMNDNQFRLMLEMYEPLYGDKVFSVLVDTVSENTDISIKDILVDFGNFINTYY